MANFQRADVRSSKYLRVYNQNPALEIIPENMSRKPPENMSRKPPENMYRKPPENMSRKPLPESTMQQAGLVRMTPVRREINEPVYDTPDVKRFRVPTEEDLKWKLKYAHLYACDWTQEILAVYAATKNKKIFDMVLRNLPEYPMSMREKMSLSKDLKKLLFRSGSSRFSNWRRKSVKAQQMGHNFKRQTSSSLGFSGNGFSPFVLWREAIGRLTAYYGTNIASYFIFLRFLVLINILMGIIMFCFVSLPQIVPGEVKSQDVKSGFFGQLSSTIFFYGAYSNTSVFGIPRSIEYKRPLAYLMSWSSTNFLTVVIIVISMYISYRRIKGYNLGDSEPYSTRLFTIWDFSVTNRKGVEKMKGFIVNYFRETIHEEKFKDSLTKDKKVKLWIIRIVCNIISVGILGGSAYLIYYVASHTIKPGLNIPTVINDFVEKYQLTLIVSGLKVVVPPILSLSLFVERYHPRTQIKVQISRTAVFYVANLVVFLASVYSISIECMNGTPANSTLPYCCWENEVGEQLFQMIILDLIVNLVVGLLVTGGQFIVFKFGAISKIGKPDFRVPNQILDLVYGQSLIWLGLYTAPFFALIALVKLVIVFYYNYGLVRIFCEPNNVFRASRSGSFYLFILLTTLFVCLFPMTYAIIKLEPSDSCGPFKTNLRVYEVLTDEIGEAPYWFHAIVHFASTPAVIIPLIIILLLIALYYKAKSSTLHSETKELRHHLDFERKVGKRKVYATARLFSETSQSDVSDLSGIGQSMTSSLLNAFKSPIESPVAQDQAVNQGRAVQHEQVVTQEHVLRFKARVEPSPGHQVQAGNGTGSKGNPADSSQVTLAVSDLGNTSSNSLGILPVDAKASAPNISQGNTTVRGQGNIPSSSAGNLSTAAIGKPPQSNHINAPITSVNGNPPKTSQDNDPRKRKTPSTSPGNLTAGAIGHPQNSSQQSVPTRDQVNSSSSSLGNLQTGHNSHPPSSKQRNTEIRGQGKTPSSSLVNLPSAAVGSSSNSNQGNAPMNLQSNISSIIPEAGAKGNPQNSSQSNVLDRGHDNPTNVTRENPQIRAQSPPPTGKLNISPSQDQGLTPTNSQTNLPNTETGSRENNVPNTTQRHLPPNTPLSNVQGHEDSAAWGNDLYIPPFQRSHSRRSGQHHHTVRAEDNRSPTEIPPDDDHTNLLLGQFDTNLNDAGIVNPVNTIERVPNRQSGQHKRTIIVNQPIQMKNSSVGGDNDDRLPEISLQNQEPFQRIRSMRSGQPQLAAVDDQGSYLGQRHANAPVDEKTNSESVFHLPDLDSLSPSIHKRTPSGWSDEYQSDRIDDDDGVYQGQVSDSSEPGDDINVPFARGPDPHKTDSGNINPLFYSNHGDDFVLDFIYY
ncbi:hypothetical protein Btru_041478 [Bulinus truncatus]|nr:hypothetical protein Btru_041478 [Bulinus truncatus]